MRGGALPTLGQGNESSGTPSPCAIGAMLNEISPHATPLAIGIVRQIAECFEIFEDVGDALFENVTYE